MKINKRQTEDETAAAVLLTKWGGDTKMISCYRKHDKEAKYTGSGNESINTWKILHTWFSNVCLKGQLLSIHPPWWWKDRRRFIVHKTFSLALQLRSILPHNWGTLHSLQVIVKPFLYAHMNTYIWLTWTCYFLLQLTISWLSCGA